DYLIYANRGRRALIVSALVKELLEQRRNNLCLNAVVVDFPRARAGEKGNTASPRPQGKMHGQTITTHQAPMILHIGKMLEERRALWKHIDRESFFFESPLQIFIVRPFLHRPDVAGFG